MGLRPRPRRAMRRKCVPSFRPRVGPPALGVGVSNADRQNGHAQSRKSIKGAMSGDAQVYVKSEPYAFANAFRSSSEFRDVHFFPAKFRYRGDGPERRQRAQRRARGGGAARAPPWPSCARSHSRETRRVSFSLSLTLPTTLFGRDRGRGESPKHHRSVVGQTFLSRQLFGRDRGRRDSNPYKHR